MKSNHRNNGADVYTVNEICQKLGMSRPQVFELIKKNEFRSIHVKGYTRISKKSFDDWLNQYVSLRQVQDYSEQSSSRYTDLESEPISEEDFKRIYKVGHTLADLDY